jgi:hypothetical protein
MRPKSLFKRKKERKKEREKERTIGVIIEAVDDDIYNDIYGRDEGIDQLLIISDHNHEPLANVLDDDERDVLMARLYTPEQPVELNEEELLEQFRDNQKKLIPEELQQYMEDVIMGKLHKK